MRKVLHIMLEPFCPDLMSFRSNSNRVPNDTADYERHDNKHQRVENIVPKRNTHCEQNKHNKRGDDRADAHEIIMDSIFESCNENKKHRQHSNANGYEAWLLVHC